MRKSTCLNGYWAFAPGTGGLFPLPEVWDEVPIHVPSPYNINSFAQGQHKNVGGEEILAEGADTRLYPAYPRSWEEAKSGFYKRNIFVSEESRGKRLFLRFEGVAFHSAFYLNGQMLGESMEAFLPVELEITDAARYGAENVLIVATRNVNHLYYNDENGKKRTDWPEGSFWGGHIAGIWQDVWLEERPAAFITELFSHCDVENRTLTIRCGHNGSEHLSLAFGLSEWGKDGTERQLPVEPSGAAYIWSYQDGEVYLWDTDHPALYTLHARLLRDGKIVDKTEIRIGFRSFKTEGENFLLNGRPLKLRNDSWHYMGYSVQTPEYARAYYRMAKDAHVNIIRLHAQPFPSFFYDMADEMGMLLISESAIWASHCNFSYNDAFFENGKRHLERLILRDRNHPSVVMWSAENECVMAWKVCGSAFIRDMDDLAGKLYGFVQTVEALDPSRPISCDGSGDLNGRLSVYSLHYPGYGPPGGVTGKPITIGEMGSMYYSTPDNIGMDMGERVFASMDGRLEAVARDAYQLLIGQRRWAAQVCVFNLVWYGLQPLKFTDAEWSYDDYTSPGIKPARITAYLRTLNAGAEDALPAYIPNPVFKWVKRAFMPVCFFTEHPPVSGWRGEMLNIPVTLFNDLSDEKKLKLSATLNADTYVWDYTLAPCSYCDDILSLPLPKQTGSYEITISLCDQNANNEIIAESLEIAVYDRDELKERWENVQIPSIAHVANAPYASFTKPVVLRRVFTQTDSFTFNHAVEGFCFDEYLPFNAHPLYFNGMGAPVAVSLPDTRGTGLQQVICGVDLAANADDPAVWNLYIAIGEYVKNNPAAAPTDAYVYAAPDCAITAMLDELRCAYKVIDKENLTALMKEKNNKLLIVDGENELDCLNELDGHNFECVLVINVDAKMLPASFGNRFVVTTSKAYHLRACGTDFLGVYGNALYGLESGREQVLAERLLCCKDKGGEIMLGIPDIDWRMWNHTAEYLKTAAVLKSEQTPRQYWAALFRSESRGTQIYFSQLSLSVQHKKAMNLYARLLSGLGCMLEPVEKNELETYVSAGVHKIIGMLHHPSGALKPGLNRIENGRAWRFISEGTRVDAGLLAVFVYSPQDQTDFLLNPDTVDMHVSAEKELTCYLNGQPQMSGCVFTVTSLPLIAGWNTLLFQSDKPMKLPEILFDRLNGQKLDLVYSLYDGFAKSLSMQNAAVNSAVQPEGTRSAIAGVGKYWHSHLDQQTGVDLSITFASSILCRAIYFSCVVDEHRGQTFTPKRFRLWAGDSAAECRVVYESLVEDHMSYRDGKVFIRLEDVQARFFKLELLENALKPWIVSEMTLL